MEADGGEKEVIVAPFTRVSSVRNQNMHRNSGEIREYVLSQVQLEPADLDGQNLTSEERADLLKSITDSAPEMCGVLDKLKSSDKFVDDLQYDIDETNKKLERALSEKETLAESYQELLLLDSERQLGEVIGLWDSARRAQEWGLGDNYNLKLKMKELGIISEEQLMLPDSPVYDRNIEKQFSTQVMGRLLALEPLMMFGIENGNGVLNNSRDENIYEAFSNFKIENGQNWESIFKNLAQACLDVSLDGVDSPTGIASNRLWKVLENSQEFFEGHLTRCGFLEPGSLEDRLERTGNNIRNYDDNEINPLKEIIEKKENELSQHEAAKPVMMEQVSNWKKSIVRLCMSDCRNAELELEAQMRAVEVEKKNAKTAEEQTRQSEAQERQTSEISSQVQETAVKNNMNLSEIQSQEKVNVEKQRQKEYLKNLDDIFKYRFDINNLHFQNGTTNFVRVKEQSERIAGAIQTISGRQYTSKIVDYEDAMKRVNNSVQKVVREGQRDDVRVEAIKVLKEVKETEFGVTDGRIQREMLAIQDIEENLLKKLVFERFCDVAINAEMNSLKNEANGIREAASKKGLSRLFGGPKKQDLERCEQIENFIETETRQGIKPYEGKRYSYREIVAEMQSFTTQHRGDVQYESAVKEVNSLQQFIGSYFSANQRDIQAVQLKLEQNQASSGMDSRAYRMRHLRENMEQKGVIYTPISRNALDSLNKTERYLSVRANDMQRAHQNDKEVESMEF